MEDGVKALSSFYFHCSGPGIEDFNPPFFRGNSKFL